MGWPGIKNYGFGSPYRSKEFDDEVRQKGLEVRRNAPIKWTKQKCVDELNEILDLLKKVLKEDKKLEKDDSKKLKNETVRDAITLMNKILDYMKYLYPPVQENINVNIEMTSDAVIERLKKWKAEQLEFIPAEPIKIKSETEILEIPEMKPENILKNPEMKPENILKNPENIREKTSENIRRISDNISETSDNTR
jgi:hypothetical protein